MANSIEKMPTGSENITEPSFDQLISSATNPEVIKIAEHGQELDKRAENAIENLGARASKEVSADRRSNLESRLDELLKSDLSEKYNNEIRNVKDAKINWANSEAFGNRLRARGADDDTVTQVKEWIVGNAESVRTFVLPNTSYYEARTVMAELSGEDNVNEGTAFYSPGGRDDISDRHKNAIYIQEVTPPPALAIPGKAISEEKKNPNIDINTLHHEYGHAAQDGLLNSELYQDWNPKVKEGAQDAEYYASITEVDVRVRALFRTLEGNYDPQQGPLLQEHLDTLKIKNTEGNFIKDVNDLFNTFDDEEIIRISNYLPAI